MRPIFFLIATLATTPALAQYYGQQANSYEQRYAEQYYGTGQHMTAAPQATPSAGLVNTDYLNFGAGATQVFDTDNNALFNLEYRYKDIYHGLRPILGFHVDTDSAMYGYFGFNWDVYLTDAWVFTPTASMGAYTQGDDGHDLGHWVEFRTGVELAYQMEDKSRVGLQLTHLSNAGLGDRNPGTEILQVNYAHPLGWAE